MKLKLLLVLSLIILTHSYAQNGKKPIQIADEFELNLSTSTNYQNSTKTGILFQKTFTNKGSAYIKLHINSFDLQPGDFLKVYSPITNEEFIYAEQGKIVGVNKEMISEFWTGTIWSDTIIIELHTETQNISHFGFNIDRVAYGHSAEKINAAIESLDTNANSRSICGADDKEPIACYDGTEMGDKAKAVCRLLINGGGLCTGWLLGCDGSLMTNNHCIGDANDANNTDFLFNYQYTNCAGTINATSDLVANSSAFVQTDGTLDFTLVQLPVNPTATYGYLSLSSVAVTAGERIYIPQHPAGRRKEIAVNTDVGGDANGFAMITNAGTGIAGSRVEYQCDTEGGSSGSPVLRHNDNLVIAIHNTGGCANGSYGRSDQLIAAIGANMPNCGVDDNNPSAPYITVQNLISEVNESTDCSYTDIDITFRIATGATQNATVTFDASGGTASNTNDFELLNGSITFPANDNTDQTATVRVYNDALVEGTEIINIQLSLNANGGDATLNALSELNINIIDDNSTLSTTQTATVFEDDFESYTDFAITNVGQWTMIDNDGGTTYDSTNTNFLNEEYTGTFIVFNPQATTPASNNAWNSYSGNKGFYCFNANISTPGITQNDDYIITPALNLTTNSQIKFWAKGLTDNFAGGERFRVLVGNGNTVAQLTTELTPTPYAQPTLDWVEYTYNIPASFDNSTAYVSINVVSTDEFVFMMDDFAVTTEINTSVQNTVNTATSDSATFNQNGTANYYGQNQDYIMSTLINNDGFDYGCVDVAVSRAGNSGQTYGGVSSLIVMDKTFTITPTNTTTTGDTDVTFYFNEAEIAGWETAASPNTRNDLYIFRVDGSTTEGVAATIGSFGSKVTLSGNFTALEGVYYFGTQAVLSIEENDLNNLFSISPNPANNYLNVNYISNNKPSNISIYNMVGQSVLTKNIHNKNDLTINTSEIATGMYFITIKTKTASQTFKFLKK